MYIQSLWNNDQWFTWFTGQGFDKTDIVVLKLKPLSGLPDRVLVQEKKTQGYFGFSKQLKEIKRKYRNNNKNIGICFIMSEKLKIMSLE